VNKPSSKKKIFGFCLISALLSGVGIEYGARWIIPDAADPIEQIRNPFRFRNFPEFVDAAVSVPNFSERAVVLIGNSQAYGGEVPDIRIYSTWLERDLCRENVGGRDDWEVFNWSTDGMTTLEHTILAAYLQEHPPAMVLSVTGFADYRAEQAEAGFSYCRSDLPRLATRMVVARAIPATYWERHFKLEDVLSAAVRARFDLPRVADYLWSYADQQYPGVQPLCYSPAVNYHPWELNLERKSPPMKIGTTEDDRIELTYDERSLEMMETYLEALAAIKAPVLVMGQPSGMGPVDTHASALKAFQQDLASISPPEGVELIDQSHLLAPELYYDKVHFNRKGHRAFANELFPLVRSRLEGSPE